jgi:hypothetical protein
MLQVGKKLHPELSEVLAMVASGILTMTLDGHPLTDEAVIRNLKPEAAPKIQVQSSSGYKLKVLKIGAQWEMEVTYSPEE